MNRIARITNVYSDDTIYDLHGILGEFGIAGSHRWVNEITVEFALPVDHADARSLVGELVLGGWDIEVTMTP